MKRIIMHWTAGAHDASALDRRHYHEIVQGDGTRVPGDLLPEANLDTRDGKYAAHTRACNTGSVGLAMAAMAGARERPFDAGPYPITDRQLKSFVAMVAEYADTYSLPITRRTVLTHAEVQPTLGIWQRGKWDIAWLPGLTRPIDPVQAGDRLRAMAQEQLDDLREAQIEFRAPEPRKPFWGRMTGLWGR